MNRNDKAKHFFSLHQANNPLVLYNVWDAGTAAAAERAGATAVATGSHSVAEAQGFADGQDIPLDIMLAISARIVGNTSLPVSIDFEGGFTEDNATLATHVERLLMTGAIGINFEDQVIGTTELHPPERQAKRIQTIRATADRNDERLFINARTDVFLKAPVAEHAGLLDDAVQRALLYKEAGASGFFAPGLIDYGLIQALCARVELPVNIMMKPGVPETKDLITAGVSRISYGPGPYNQAINAFESAVQAAMSF